MKRTILALTISFFIVFSGLAMTGAYIIYSESSYAQSRNDDSSSSNTGVKVEVDTNSATFEITNALPGMVVLFFGVTGLILMMIKVPIREGLISDIKSSNMDDRIIISKHSDIYRSIKISENIKHTKKYMNRIDIHRKRKVPLPVFWSLRLYKKFRK